LKGKGAASGSSGAYGYQEWNGTLSSRSEVAGYLDVDTVSGVYSVDSISTSQSVSQSLSNSVSNYYYGETEGYANGKAQAQASPKNGVAATSLDASANGYSWSGVLQGGMGSASATGQVSASSDVDPDGTGGSFGTLQFDRRASTTRPGSIIPVELWTPRQCTAGVIPWDNGER